MLDCLDYICIFELYALNKKINAKLKNVYSFVIILLLLYRVEV